MLLIDIGANVRFVRSTGNTEDNSSHAAVIVTAGYNFFGVFQEHMSLLESEITSAGIRHRGWDKDT